MAAIYRNMKQASTSQYVYIVNELGFKTAGVVLRCLPVRKPTTYASP